MFKKVNEKSMFSKFTLYLSLLSFVWVIMGCDIALAQTKVTIPAGTIVSLLTYQSISPEVHKIGDRVSFTVAYDVVIDGKTVIKAGTDVFGEITESKLRGAIGQAAKIGMSIRRVNAVDGTIVPLYGAKFAEGQSKMGTAIVVTVLCCVLGLLIKGGDAEIPSGSEIQAETAGTIVVLLD